MVTITVGNVSSKIITTLPEGCSRDLDRLLSFTVSGSYFILKNNPTGWDGRTHLYYQKSQVFPTGLLLKVTSYLDEKGLAYEIRDYRTAPILGHSMPYTNILREFQQEIVDKAIFIKKRGIIKSPTGSGKTLMMMTIIAELNLPTIILVNKKDLLYQTHEKIKEYLGYDAGIIGDGNCKIDSKINICMIQTLCNVYKIALDKEFDEEDKTTIKNVNEIVSMVENCELLCIDEVHHLSSRTMYNFQKKCVKAYYRFGFSATPYTTSNKDLLLEAGIAPVFADINLSLLVEKGFIAKPTFYWIEFSHRGQPYAHAPYPELYKKAVIQNEKRNKLIVELALKAYKEGKRILISVNSIEHGLLLEHMFRIALPRQKEFFIRGSTPSEVRNSFRELLNTGDIRLVIATVIWNEAVDIPELDVIINTKAQKSIIDFLQLIGRALRITKSKRTATIIDIHDKDCNYLNVHSMRRKETVENEPLVEHQIIRIKNKK